MSSGITNQFDPLADTSFTPEDNAPYYEVDYGFFKIGELDKQVYIITHNGVPAPQINRPFVTRQMNYSRPNSTLVYYLCAFLNTAIKDGYEHTKVTYDYLINYLTGIYCDEGKSFAVLKTIIEALRVLYEHLARRSVHLDQSLLLHTAKTVIVKGKGGSLTRIAELLKEFPRKRTDLALDHSLYTKWYTNEQIIAICDALPIVDRCIFADTVYTGHRVETALSLQLGDVDLYNGTVFGRVTKTGKNHIAPIPNGLVELIDVYIRTKRNTILERTNSSCPYLFLTRDGRPRTYASYYTSLKRVEKLLTETRPELGITSLHTHAGRSTFLARLRTAQLEQQKLGNNIITDNDILTAMDWRNMSSLEHYDILTRALDTLSFQDDLLKYYFDFDKGGKHNNADRV